MAGIFYDGFDHYATADIATKWTQRTVLSGVGPVIGATGRRGGGALRMATTTFGYGDSVRITPSSPVPSGATCVVGFAFRHVNAFATNNNNTTEDSGSNSSASCLVSIRKVGGTHVWFRINANGTISAFHSTSLLGTTSVALTQNVYQYLEFKVLIHASAGTITVRLNGSAVLTLTGQVSQTGGSSTWDEIKLGTYGSDTVVFATVDYDDLYLLDGSGSVNNDFLGDVRVDAVYPNAAGNSSQFTRSAGSDQWAGIDETAPNADTDYNETATATNRDTLNFPNAPVAGATIFGIQASASVKKTDAGGAGLKLVTRISGTDYDGTEVGLGTAYTYVRQIWDVKPSDSTAWTDSAFNAAEFGYVKST